MIYIGLVVVGTVSLYLGFVMGYQYCLELLKKDLQLLEASLKIEIKKDDNQAR